MDLFLSLKQVLLFSVFEFLAMYVCTLCVCLAPAESRRGHQICQN